MVTDNERTNLVRIWFITYICYRLNAHKIFLRIVSDHMQCLAINYFARIVTHRARIVSAILRIVSPRSRTVRPK